MDKEVYYLLAITVSSVSALISVIAAFNTFKFSKSAKHATKEKFELDRTKYMPFFQANLDEFVFNSEKRRHEGKVTVTNTGEVTQQLDSVTIRGSAELVPSGTFIISTPELLKNRVSLKAESSHTVGFVIPTWDVRIKEANIEALINTSNAYMMNERILLDCGNTEIPIPES